MVLDTASTSRILSSRCSDKTTSPLCGICPPTRPVLPPCGTIAVEVSLAIFNISETSAVEPGRRIAGECPVHSARCSTRNGACRSGSVTAFFSPKTAIMRGRTAGEAMMFGLLMSFMGSTFLRRRGSGKPVVDRFAKPRHRHAHHGNGGDPGLIEGAQIGKKVCGCFDQIV